MIIAIGNTHTDGDLDSIKIIRLIRGAFLHP